MTSSVKRPNFLNAILQVLLAVSLLGFVLSAALMFITSNARGVYAYGSIAIFCLLDAVGITLIQRWHKVGIWLCLVACLIECSSLFILGLPWSSSTSISTTINYFPYLAIFFAYIIMVAPLFVLKVQPSGKTIWSEMRSGMDVKHSRHIYQLTSVLLVGIIITILFYKPSITEVEEPSSNFSDSAETVVVPQRTVNYSLLDSANVTLSEIESIETMIDSVPSESQLIYNKRIFALKHVLLSGLMTEAHNVLNLKNICKIHTGDFSTEQQRILDWYLTLPLEEQEVWLDCPSVNNLSDFEKEVKQRITTK